MFSLHRATISPILGAAPSTSLGADETGSKRLLGQFGLPTLLEIVALFGFVLLWLSCELEFSVADGVVGLAGVLSSMITH